MTAPLALVVLCTGNICRSPLAEVLLRDRLSDLPVVVTSAGTRAVVGAPMAPSAAVRVVGRGLDPAHAAVQVTADQLVAADLVLGLAREHRRTAIELHPRVVRRAMTLLELVRVVAQHGEAIADEALAAAPDVEGRLREAVRLAVLERGTTLPATTPELDDVPDPWGRDDRAYAAADLRISGAVDTISAWLHRAAGTHRASPEEPT
jgi:protein-tyrosine phosphatase